MSEITLSFQCEDYLRQWFINDAGGSHPVRLRKNSPESSCLQFCLQPKSKAGKQPEIEGTPLIVYIPEFRYKNPDDYNYISNTGRIAFIKILKQRFDLELWNDLHQFANFGIRKDELIYAWMESHEIEPTEKNFNAIAKRLQRMRERSLSRIRVRNFRKKRK